MVKRLLTVVLRVNNKQGGKVSAEPRPRVPLNTSQAAFKAPYMRQIPVWATRRGTIDANIWGLNLIPKFVVHDKRFSGLIVWQVGELSLSSIGEKRPSLVIGDPNQITTVKTIMIMQAIQTRPFSY